MTESTIEVRAADGLSLTGLFAAPPDARATIVWIHGFGVSYDLPQCLRLARAAARRGMAFISAGLRSQHGACTGWVTTDGRTRFARTGGWYEVFEESVLDIDAWVRFAVDEAGGPVILAGHSFGSLRAAYYLAQATSPCVDAVVLGSFSFGLRQLEREVADRAHDLVEAGCGAELLPAGSWSLGFGTDTVSAQTYASWWRVAPGFFGEPAGTLAAVGRPTFAWYGTRSDVGGAAELAWLRKRLLAAPRVETALLDDVSHGYDGGEETIAEAIAARLPDLVECVGTTR